MLYSGWNRRLWSAVLALAVSAPGVSLAKEAEHDDANARREARDQWYNETYGQAHKGNGRHARGGPWSAAFQKFMNDAARRERELYGSMLPSASSTTLASDGTTTLAATGSTWVNIGPVKADYAQNGSSNLTKSDSGRVRTILTDPANPNILYAAFAGAGVWKSSDGGATWSAMTDTLGSLSVGDLEMDPSNSQTLYLGLGDPFDGTGVGLVKSTDGGNTWFNPVYLGDSTTIGDVMVAPGNTNIVLVATNTGLYRSVDAGASFSAVPLNTGFAAKPHAWSLTYVGGSSFVLTLEADPASTTYTQGQVWRSTDNGATWTRSTGFGTTVERMTVAAAPSNRNIVYALAGNHAGDLADLYKSTNGGVSFTAMAAAGARWTNGNMDSRSVGTIFNGQGWYDQMLIVSPTDANTFYFGGALQLGRGSGAKTAYTQMTNWLAQYGLPYLHADIHAGHFAANGKFYVGTDGGLAVSSDNGTTWSQDLNVGIASHLIYNIGTTAGNRNAVIAGLQDNGTRVRSGATGTYNQEIGGDGFGCDINASNPNLMLGSLYYARIQKSTDGGLNFASACSGITECNNSSTAPFETKVIPWTGDATGNTVFTFSNTKVYKSTNYAGSWAALGATGLPTDLYIRNVGVAKSNANVVGIAGNGGRVFLSNNGGASWTQAAALPNNGSYTSDVFFDINNPNIVYLTSVAPYGTYNHLWKSTDFGATWTVSESGLPAGVPVNTVVGDPGDSNVLYAGTHLGVYRSTDAGATWTRFGAGMPLVNVTDVQILPDSSLVRAATFGRSVWELQP